MNMCQPYLLPSWICAINNYFCQICCSHEYVSAIFVAILNLCQLWLSCWIIIFVSYIAIMNMCQPYLFLSWTCVSHICCHHEFVLTINNYLCQICCYHEYVSAIFVAIQNLCQPYLLPSWICISNDWAVMYVSYRSKVRLKYKIITNILIIVV